MWRHSSPWGVTWVPCFYPFGCSGSLSFLCEVCVVHTYMWVCRFIPVCRHVETRAGCGVSPSIICLFTLRQVLTEPEAILGWLAGGQTSEIYLSPLTPPPSAKLIALWSHAQLFTWALQIETPVLMFAEQGLLITESSLLPSCFFFIRILLLALKQKTQLAFDWNLLRLQIIGRCSLNNAEQSHVHGHGIPFHLI